MAKNKSLMTPVPSRSDKTATQPVPSSPLVEEVSTSERVTPVSAKPTASAMPFGAENYRFMIIGVAVILIGFFIMTLDKEEFGFGFLGLTLGPLIVLSGFIIEFFAILKRPRQ